MLTVAAQCLHGPLHLCILEVEVDLAGHLTGRVPVSIQMLIAAVVLQGSIMLLILSFDFLFLFWQIESWGEKRVIKLRRMLTHTIPYTLALARG